MTTKTKERLFQTVYWILLATAIFVVTTSLSRDFSLAHKISQLVTSG